MSFEIEAKFRVDSHEPLRQRLRALGAAHLACVVETNLIFDRPDGSLRARGCGLRIRFTVAEGATPAAGAAVPEGAAMADSGDVAAAPRGGRSMPCDHPTTLTFKGPVADGHFKSREEIEVRVSDADATAVMLDRLGFVRILAYQKRRESWRLRDCRVELDEPPHIGLFVEIEGPDEHAIRAVQHDLGLDGAVHVRSSYVRMLMSYCDDRGLKDRVLDLPPR